MDNQRLLLSLALTLVVLFLWQAWVDQNPVETVAAPTTTPTAPATPAVSSVPAPSADATPAPAPAAAPAVPAGETVADPKAAIKLDSGQRIRVVTDVLDIDIDTVGGDIRRAFLLRYPIEHDKPDQPFPFMNDTLPRFFIAQSGLLSTAPAPDHKALYAAEKNEYKLVGDTLVVPLVWQGADGIRVTKTFTFHVGSYEIDVKHTVENTSGNAWTGSEYRQFQRTEYDEPGKSRMLVTFSGGAISTPDEPYKKIAFSDMAEWKPEQSYVANSWVAMMQHYFVSAWIPESKTQANHLFTRVTADQRYILGMTSEQKTVAAGQSGEFVSHLYIGPKEQNRLEPIAENLNLTVDYGFLYMIAQPLFWALSKIHGVVGNWGWAIIILTLFVKLLFYKLSETSYKSMANMRKLAPKFQSIRERFGEDRQRMSQAMMELYKKEKVNPLSGCWPMLVQIPVFIALYWVLLETVELRQADFMLWIDDLSAKDPYYVLPLLMGATMYLQQKMSANPSLDPLQQKIMQYLPLVFTLFFMLFPAGLVLYWVVSNILSIAQQWYIMRKIERAGT